MSGLLGLLVDGARLFAFANDSAHGAGADLDGHVVDRGVVGQRECVDRFDILRSGVLECLGDVDAGEESGDGAANFGVAKRAGAADGSVFADDSEGSRGLLRSQRKLWSELGQRRMALRVTTERHTTTDRGRRRIALHTCLREQAIGIWSDRERCLRFEFFATTFVAWAAMVRYSAVMPRLLSGIDRFNIVIVPWVYEILNGVESNSCAGIEVASAILLRALRATADEGVRGYMVRRKSKPPPCLAKNARQGWGTLTSNGAPSRLEVFQPSGFARRFYGGEPAADEK